MEKSIREELIDACDEIEKIIRHEQDMEGLSDRDILKSEVEKMYAHCILQFGLHKLEGKELSPAKVELERVKKIFEKINSE